MSSDLISFCSHQVHFLLDDGTVTFCAHKLSPQYSCQNCWLLLQQQKAHGMKTLRNGKTNMWLEDRSSQANEQKQFGLFFKGVNGKKKKNKDPKEKDLFIKGFKHN